MLLPLTIFTTYHKYLPHLPWHLSLTTYHTYHIPLTTLTIYHTYHLTLTTYHLPLTTYHTYHLPFTTLTSYHTYHLPHLPYLPLTTLNLPHLPLVSAQEYFEFQESHRCHIFQTLARKYKAIGPLLIKVEGLVASTNTGKSPKLKHYYAYWEKRIFDSLIKVSFETPSLLPPEHIYTEMNIRICSSFQPPA